MPGTLRKPWRRHHELDGLGDAECREMIERDWRRRPPRLGLITVGATIAAMLSVPAGIMFFLTFFPIADDPGASSVPIYAVLIPALALLAVGVGAGAHWLLLRLLMRRTLARIIAGAVCPRCRHSLRGLPLRDDPQRPEDLSRKWVRCPECGKAVRLIKYGYGPQDLAGWDQRVLPKDFEVRLKS